MAVIASLASPAFAQGKKKRKKPASESAEASYQYPYGMAGCGLGTLVITENEKWPQVGAWFINNLVFNPTFAMTSGTSGCVEAGKKMATEKSVFLKVNMASLERDAAMGSGSSLNAFAELLGCFDDEAKQTLFKVSQSHYSEIFASDDAEVVPKNYLRIVEENDRLRAQCAHLV